MGTHQMKMSKATKEDIEMTTRFMMALEEVSKGHFKLKEWDSYAEGDEGDKKFYHLLKSMTDENDRLDLDNLLYTFNLHYSHLWRRVVMCCDILIDNVCDPKESHLAYKPEILSMDSLLKEMDKYLSENPKNSIGSGSVFHQRITELMKEEKETKETESK